MFRIVFVAFLACFTAACATTGGVPGEATAPTGPVAAAPSDGVGTPVAQRSLQIPALFSGNPGGFEAIFAPSFLAKIPPSQLAAVFKDYFQRLGPCTDVVAETSGDPSSGKFSLRFGSKFTVPLTVVVAPEAPHPVIGLWLGNPIPAGDGLQAIEGEMKELPGTVSFLVTRLGDEPEVLAALAPDTPLAIGSAFKLYVLAELVRSVKAGERSWSDVVELQAGARSLPSGFLQQWPTGAPITVHTLASLMISQSDNTATDQLVHVLGRENVEAILPVTGHHTPKLNRPFLTTLEVFKLKGEPKGEVARAFLSADEGERRNILATSVPAIAREGLLPLVSPRAIDTLEWFASAADLSRVMDWLERETRDGAGLPARELLAINRGPGIVADFRYVGFKGGSEPGVLNATFLLEHRDGSFSTLVATWNDREAPLDEARFFLLVDRALRVVGRE